MYLKNFHFLFLDEQDIILYQSHSDLITDVGALRNTIIFIGLDSNLNIKSDHSDIKEKYCTTKCRS